MRHLAFVLAVAVCIAIAPNLWAQSATDLLAEGVALREAGKEKEALAKFREAYALEATPRAAAQMGLAEKSLRSYLDAEKHLDEALAAESDPWVSKNREALELARGIVVKHLAWLDVSCNVAGATLRVNGAVAGELPRDNPIRVLAGRLILELTHAGWVTARRELEVPAAVHTELDITLDKDAPPPVPATPSKAPPSPPPKKKPAPPTDELVEAPSWAPWIISTGAVGVASLAVGIGLGVRAIDLKNERDDLCPTQRCGDSMGIELDEQARDIAIGSTVGFVVGGVGIATAIVLWLVEPDADAVTVANGQLSWAF